MFTLVPAKEENQVENDQSDFHYKNRQRFIEKAPKHDQKAIGLFRKETNAEVLDVLAEIHTPKKSRFSK